MDLRKSVSPIELQNCVCGGGRGYILGEKTHTQVMKGVRSSQKLKTENNQLV